MASHPEPNEPTPKISVIMPLFNTAPYVGAAVESLLAQTFEDFELLVVDDGSTDGSPGIVSAFTDPRIRLFQEGKLGGPAAARNLGLTKARGNYIAFFDSDDLATPNMLAELIEFLTTHPDFRIVGGWLETIDEQECSFGKGSGCQVAPETLASTMLFRNCLPTSTLCMHRNCLDGQEFDVSLTLASDYDMWAKLVIKHKAHVLPRVLGRYRWHPQNITHQKKAFGDECRNRIFRRQLARLGVEPSPEETLLHARLTKLTFGTSKQTALAAESWLLKLAEANTASMVYAQEVFRRTLADQWYAVCHSAAGQGWWTFWTFIHSPLAKWASLTAGQYYNLLRLSARGALKKMLVRATHPPETSLNSPHQ